MCSSMYLCMNLYMYLGMYDSSCMDYRFFCDSGLILYVCMSVYGSVDIVHVCISLYEGWKEVYKSLFCIILFIAYHNNV